MLNVWKAALMSLQVPPLPSHELSLWEVWTSNATNINSINTNSSLINMNSININCGLIDMNSININIGLTNSINI